MEKMQIYQIKAAFLPEFMTSIVTDVNIIVQLADLFIRFLEGTRE